MLDTHVETTNQRKGWPSKEEAPKHGHPVGGVAPELAELGHEVGERKGHQK